MCVCKHMCVCKYAEEGGAQGLVLVGLGHRCEQAPSGPGPLPLVFQCNKSVFLLFYKK